MRASEGRWRLSVGVGVGVSEGEEEDQVVAANGGPVDEDDVDDENEDDDGKIDKVGGQVWGCFGSARRSACLPSSRLSAPFLSLDTISPLPPPRHSKTLQDS